MRVVPFALASVLALGVPFASTAPASATVSSAPGSSTTVPDWRMRSDVEVGVGGGTVSSPSYSDSGWTTVPARSTVVAGLVAAGRYPDLNFGENLKSVARSDFEVPWWYRKAFRFEPRAGVRTFLELDGGIISRGEIWLNGAEVAGSDVVVGAYPTHEFDVTSLLRKGTNALAIRASAADPARDLAIHFVDWSQPPPDRNQGIFRDVRFASGGAVSLRFPRVSTDLPLPDLSRATVSVRVDARNNTGSPVTAVVSGTYGDGPFRTTVSLGAGETRTVSVVRELRSPRVWWPFRMGGQPLYDLSLTASVGGAVSDVARTSFGVREVSSVVEQGARRFFVNGEPFLVRGGGWASDLFLRTDVRRIADQLALVRSMGLNLLRLEGKPENDEFYAIADRLGIMVLTGWECCSKWEDYASFGAEDYRVAGESAASEGRRVRNHPSVIGFLIGSDRAPGAVLEKVYLDGLARAEWELPVIPSAQALSSPVLGASGMKMAGPYWWEPPSYWYDKRAGGASGFASEIGPGPAVPEMAELRKFLSPSDIARLTDYSAVQYHLSPSATFDKFSFWGKALDARYGPPSTPDSLVRLAQLAGYETVRAQFEAFGRNGSDRVRPATGVVHWMVNNAWPTLYWHLFDYYLATGGGYFGAKTALRPLHVQYSYDDGSVAVANTGLSGVAGMSVSATVFEVDGTVRAEETWAADVPGNGAVRVGTLPAGAGGTYFARLLLKDSTGRVVDRNVYWLSTRADTLDYTGSTWYHTPQSGYADLSGVRSLPEASVAVGVASSGGVTEVTLRNTGGGVAFFVRATVRKGVGGAEVLPTDWSDNYVTLWPGETLTLRATYRPSDLAGARPTVDVEGVNLPLSVH
ncbi:exo-beta-D-glucosaminidase [Actinosynnema sp. NPDC020468]|uniref:glycoside hydrolase family 2 protein n=1 Tax=Actinosynnema sp. NPDC020468 TaxID=3154488 RepID=UPI0033DE2047